MTLLALIAACILPIEGLPATTHFPRLETNNVYDCEARLTFTQILPYDRTGEIAAWRASKPEHYGPIRSHTRGGYVWMFWDGDVLRCVRSDSWCESWEQYDKEIEARARLPKEQRTGFHAMPEPSR